MVMLIHFVFNVCFLRCPWQRFLSEYGMIWVGDGDGCKTTREEEGEDPESSQSLSSSDRDTWQPG